MQVNNFFLHSSTGLWFSFSCSCIPYFDHSDSLSAMLFHRSPGFFLLVYRTCFIFARFFPSSPGVSFNFFSVLVLPAALYVFRSAFLPFVNMTYSLSFCLVYHCLRACVPLICHSPFFPFPSVHPSVHPSICPLALSVSISECLFHLF